MTEMAIHLRESETSEPRKIDEFRSELRELIRARYPIVLITTQEEDRTFREVQEIADSLAYEVACWSSSRGVLTQYEAKGSSNPANQFADIVAGLEIFEKLSKKRDKPHVFVIFDAMSYMSEKSQNPIYIRKLKDLASKIRTEGYRGTCILLSSNSEIPFELEKEITLMDFPLPGRAEIHRIIDIFFERYHESKIVQVSEDPNLKSALANAALGLTVGEIEGALARAVVADRRLDHDDVEKIFKQKQQIIRKSGILDYIDTRGLSLEDVGGLERLKDWLEIRDRAFSAEGRAYGIAAPKGVLVCGLPGCGKSLSAKCVASTWNLPLIRLDMGKVYSSLIGSSEERMRAVIKTCEAVTPCVLWIDEIEKGMPRSSRFVGDSGVSLRVVGSFLTWLQEKTSPVFVFATANQLDLLPPELLRKGRFDEIFFVDLPTDRERREIIEIHLRKRNRNPEVFDIERLTALSGEPRFGEGVSLTGAEIESWINEALIASFHEHHDGERDVQMSDFETTIERIVPLAKMRNDEISSMREWAQEHAVAASDTVSKSKPRSEEVVVSGRSIDL